MLGKLIQISIFNYDWSVVKPIIRYVIGITFIFGISSLLGYPLSYLTSVLALGYIAPGAKPLTFKQASGFMTALIIINIFAFIFSAIFIDYPLMFMPLLALSILWLYYTDKLPVIVKLFAIISMLVIPLISLEGNAVGGFIAISLVFNAFMAILLTQLVFKVIPWSDADEVFAKSKQDTLKQTEQQRFKYAFNILIILMPALLLFFIFKLTGGMLVLIFIGVLSVSPTLSSAKFGAVMIVANVLGGIFAILTYNLLTIVPLFAYMILLILLVGFLFAGKLFSKAKISPVFGTAFSTFLLILGSVTSSDSDAGSEVWSRVLQIAMAVIYVVIAFGILNHIQSSKALKRI